MTTWATLPSASTMISGVAAWSDPIFTSFIPIVLLAVGIVAGLILIGFIMSMFVMLFRGFFMRGSQSAMVSTNTFEHLPSFGKKVVSKLDSFTFRHSKQGRSMMNDTAVSSPGKKINLLA